MIYQSLLRKLQLSLLAATFFAVFNISNANAFTVHDAMLLAYENNYQVLAEQENLNATELAKPRAYADFLPRASVSRSFDNVHFKNTQTTPNVRNQSRNDNLTVTQPIFSGGSSYFGVKTAESQVKAGRNRFKSVSDEIALAAVRAYENLLTTREIYNLSVNNEKVLKTNLNFTRTRFKHGEVTKTDVLQAEARYAAAIAEKERSDGNVMSSIATFERIIGFKTPQNMEAIKVDSVDIPDSFEQFLQVALENNPALLTAKFNSKASEQNVNTAYSRIMPTVNATAVFRRSSDNSSLSADSNTYSINVSVPIFQNGSEYVNIGESKYLSSRAKYEFFESERQVKESAIRAWNDLKTTKAVIKSRTETITAARKALSGVREEAKIGTRTTLDVLDAEQELFSAKVNLRTAQRDYVIAAFSILQIMGAINLFDLADL